MLREEQEVKKLSTTYRNMRIVVSLFKKIEDLLAVSARCVLMNDFNHRLGSLDSIAGEFLDLLLPLGFTVPRNSHIYVDCHGSSELDSIAFFDFDLVRHGTGEYCFPGGHVLLFCEFKGPSRISLSAPSSKPSRSFKNYSAFSFLSALSPSDFSPLYSSADPSSFVDKLSELILSCLDSVALLSSSLSTCLRAFEETWRTPELAMLEKLTSQAYKKYKRSGNSSQLGTFRDLRRRSSSLCSHLFNSFIRGSIAACRSQTDIWKVLDRLGSRGGMSPPNPCSPSEFASFLVDLPGRPKMLKFIRKSEKMLCLYFLKYSDFMNQAENFEKYFYHLKNQYPKRISSQWRKNDRMRALLRTRAEKLINGELN